MELTIKEIIDALSDDQKQLAYYCCGYAVETGKSPRRSKQYRELVKPMDDLSKRFIDAVIDEAINEGKKGAVIL